MIVSYNHKRKETKIEKYVIALRTITPFIREKSSLER